MVVRVVRVRKPLRIVEDGDLGQVLSWIDAVQNRLGVVAVEGVERAVAQPELRTPRESNNGNKKGREKGAGAVAAAAAGAGAGAGSCTVSGNLTGWLVLACLLGRLRFLQSAAASREKKNNSRAVAQPFVLV